MERKDRHARPASKARKVEPFCSVTGIRSSHTTADNRSGDSSSTLAQVFPSVPSTRAKVCPKRQDLTAPLRLKKRLLCQEEDPGSRGLGSSREQDREWQVLVDLLLAGPASSPVDRRRLLAQESSPVDRQRLLAQESSPAARQRRRQAPASSQEDRQRRAVDQAARQWDRRTHPLVRLKRLRNRRQRVQVGTRTERKASWTWAWHGSDSWAQER